MCEYFLISTPGVTREEKVAQLYHNCTSIVFIFDTSIENALN